MINRENYEIYFIDYFDGNISEEAESALFLFLEQNQDLKEEFYEFENLKIIPDEIVETPNFKSLKKEPVISATNEDDYFIAHLENDLSLKEESELLHYLKGNSSSQKKFERYKEVKLIPPSLSFEEKESLKKRAVIIPFRNYLIGVSIAASILFIIWLSPFTSPVNQGKNYNLALKIPNISREVISDIDTNKINTPTYAPKYNTNSIKIHDRVENDLVATNSIQNSLDVIQKDELKLVSAPDVFTPILLEDDLALVQTSTPTNKQTNVITPRQLVNRGISSLFLDQPKDDLKTNDLLAAVGIDVKKKQKESTKQNSAKPSNDEYFTIKIGKIFEFKRKKRK